ncbi:tyrosine-type recombinase/integrase [Simiaoa sp.]|uniref:tyrosine-type recombinase/integrase n=1 Tax=Simiaoa sp. TaxID=2944202 RepID=UPI003F81B806
MSKKHPAVTITMIDRYLTHLREQERSAATLQKYRHYLNELCGYLHNAPLNKSALIDWKELLISKYAPATVNSMLIAVNGYLRFYGWQGLSVKLLKVQKVLFIDESKELTKAEYDRLVQETQRKNNERLALVIQTICATGRPLDRSNIWRDMKGLCESAGVAPEKVFPHSLRHLFARTFYSLERDLSRLADILGHSSIVTTRIYTAESGAIHARQMGRLGLVIT